MSAIENPTERWGLGDAGWLLAWVVVAGGIGIAITEGAGLTADDAWTDVVFAVLLLGPLALVPIVVAHRKGSGWRSAFDFALNRRAIAVGLVCGALALGTSAALLLLVQALTGQEAEAATAESLSSADGAAFVTLLLLGVIGAPVAEELTFRGLVWSAVVKRGLPAWSATLIAALPFALIHLEPLRTIPLLASGLLFGLARQRGGLGAAIIAHLVINATAGIGTLVSG